MISGGSICFTKVSTFQGFKVKNNIDHPETLKPCSYGSLLPRTSGLAESQGLCRSDLSGHRAISEGGDLRLNLSDQKGRCFGSVKHRGRTRQTNFRRVSALSRAGSRLPAGTRHSTAFALDLNYLKPDQYEILDRDAYQVLGLLNRLIESLRKKPFETLKL
jgi:hypothetical protein